jgi:hypothetical protein
MYITTNDKKHWIIDKIEKLEIKDKKNDVVVITFDPEHINICDAATVLQSIEEAYPNHNIIGTIKNIAEISVENIDYMIGQLQKMKEEKQNEDIH